jgi:hypothetical protein
VCLCRAESHPNRTPCERKVDGLAARVIVENEDAGRLGCGQRPSATPTVVALLLYVERRCDEFGRTYAREFSRLAVR